MKICITVFIHELKKLFSDRKLLASIFLMPVLVVLMTSFLTPQEPEASADGQTYRIYALDQALPYQKTTDGVEIVPVYSANLEALTASVTLRPEDVVLEMTATGTTIYFNSTSSVSQNLSSVCKQLLADSSLAAFASANMVDIASRISITDISADTDTGINLVAIMFPYMLVLLLFVSTSGYAVDTIAGEKERGVFSKLLLAPVSPAPVIGGKLLSSAVCGVLSCGAYIGVVLGSAYITGRDSFGLLDANITPPMIFLLALCSMLLSYFFANLSVLCSLYAKTVKEANAMKMPVYGVTMVLALMSMLRMGNAPLTHYLIPIYNVCIVMQDILTASMDVAKMLVTAASLLLCSFAVAMITILSFKRETIRY